MNKTFNILFPQFEEMTDANNSTQAEFPSLEEKIAQYEKDIADLKAKVEQYEKDITDLKNKHNYYVKFLTNKYASLQGYFSQYFRDSQHALSYLNNLAYRHGIL